MKTLKFVAFLFYRYYSSGVTRNIAYISTICAMVMLFGLHLFQILLLFDAMIILPTSSGNSRWVNFLLTAVYLLPAFIITVILIRPAELRSIVANKEKIRKGNIYLIGYIILSIMLLVFIAEVKR